MIFAHYFCDGLCDDLCILKTKIVGFVGSWMFRTTLVSKSKERSRDAKIPRCKFTREIKISTQKKGSLKESFPDVFV